MNRIILFLLLVNIILLLLIIYIKKSILKLEDFKFSDLSEECKNFYKTYYEEEKYFKDRNLNDNQKICVKNINKSIIEDIKDNSKNNILEGPCIVDDMFETEKIKDKLNNICYKNPPFKYHRDYFVNTYDDTNNDMCDTRSEVLSKYSNNEVKYNIDPNNKNSCIIDEGLWNSYFTYHYDQNNLVTKPIQFAKKYYKEEESQNYKLNLDGNNISKNCKKEKVTGVPKEVLNYMINNKSNFKDFKNVKEIVKEYDTIMQTGKNTRAINTINELKLYNCVIQDSSSKVKLTKPENVLDIDHIVPLENAWYSGAWKWKPWQLFSYANDMTPGHLEVTPATMNRSKSYKSIDEWKPTTFNDSDKFKDLNIKSKISNEADCEYAANYSSIKHRWNLGITDQEYNELNNIFDKKECETSLSKYPVDFNLYGKSLNLSETNPNLIAFGINDKNSKKYKDIINLQNKYKQYCTPITQINNKINTEFKNDILNDTNSKNLELWNKKHFINLYTSASEKEKKNLLCQVLFKNIK